MDEFLNINVESLGINSEHSTRNFEAQRFTVI